MTDTSVNVASVSIRGAGLCIADETLATSLGFEDCGIDASVLPAMVRRRTSIATRVAVSAASRACQSAGTEPNMAAIFVSAAGEMQVTDKLCSAIAEDQYPLSPTLFHNSVHNTAAGYWSIATGSMASMQAMGALQDGFALALLEAWCQLQIAAEQVLLVCYDESLPREMLPTYEWQPCAMAFLLDRKIANGNAVISRPVQSMPQDNLDELNLFSQQSPAMAALALFTAWAKKSEGYQKIELSKGQAPWSVDFSYA